MLASATAHTLASPRLSRAGAAGRPGVAATRRLPLAAARCSATVGAKAQKLDLPPAAAPPSQLLARSIAAVAVSGLLLFSAVPPSMAELVTVTPQDATQMARPLKKQQFNKGRIWGLFVLGATALFGCTVVLENNSKLFPAISRSNQAMRMARKQQEEREAASAAEQAAFEQRLLQVREERQHDAGAEAAVMEGLLEAREARGVGGGVSAGPAASLAAAAPAAVAATALAEEAAAVSEALANGQVEAEERHEGEVREEAAPSSSTSDASSMRSASGDDSPAAAEDRVPVFEISAEQIEASAQQRRVDELQQELERRRQAAEAASAGAGSSSSAQQE